MLKEIFHDSFLKFRNLQGFVWKTMHTRLCGKSCFSHTSAFNLWRPFRFPNFNMFFSACVNKIFQKWTVFVFSESWSRDHCHTNGVLSMLEEQSTYPGQLSSRATTRASPSLKRSSAKKRAARMGVSPSTVCLERWRFSAHVCRRCDIRPKFSFFAGSRR